MAGNNILPASLRQPIRLIITEIIPQILVSDGYHFVEAVFTKDCINDLKRGGYQKEFTRLRDKVIFVSKWSLQVDYADSQLDYHSYENFKIRLVIEQFTPKLHENLQKSLSFSAKSIYKCEETKEKIQPLIQNFRHWIQQTLICKSAWSQNKSQKYFQKVKSGSKKNYENVIDYESECCDIQMPSFKEIMCQPQNVFQNNGNQNGNQQNQKQFGDKNKQKKRINTTNQSHNSQNTTQQSINDPLQNASNANQNDEILEDDKNDDYQKFGGQIQSSEVFRYNQQEFLDPERIQDKFGELEEFKQQLLIRKNQFSKDLREFDIQRTILQEQGELAYEQKYKSKSTQWLDKVQDEMIREQIKCKIDYFQIGSENLLDNLQSTLQQKDSKSGLNLRNTRKLAGYTIIRKASDMKNKLIEIKDQYKNTILTTSKKRTAPNNFFKGNRPRANSQEDILQLRDESQCDNIMENTTKIKKREGLSQSIYQKNYQLDNNETQSEKSDMDSELEGQLMLEKQGKAQKKFSELDQTLNQCQANIGMFNSYLQWMQTFKIASIESFNRLNEEIKDNKQEQVKKIDQAVSKKRNEHRNSRKATKYVDDGDDIKYFQQEQEEVVQEEVVQEVELIKEEDKMETWSEQKEEKNKDMNQIDDYQYQQNLQLESLSQSSESVKEQDVEMKDLEQEQIVQSSENNQLNLIADSSSSTNVNNTITAQIQCRTPQIKYRPPFIEPQIMDPTQTKFVFECSEPPPQPQKPINQMSQTEKQFFDMEMEDYINSREIEEKKMKQIFIKQQKQHLFLKLIEDEKRNYEKTQMSIEDFESRQMLQYYQIEQDQKLKEQQNRLIQIQQEKEKLENEERLEAQRQNQINVQVNIQNQLKQQYREMVESNDKKSENEESVQTLSEQSEQNSKQNNQDSLESRRAYAEQMTKKLGRVFDREISKCTQRDMQLRDYKSQENTDKRHDVLKAFEDKQKKMDRFKQFRQRTQAGILMQEEDPDKESQKSPKFQSLEDAEKQLSNKEYLKSDDKKNMEQGIKHRENKHGVEDDFPSFQENHEEPDDNQMEVEQSQHESPQKQENNDQEGQEDEWDEPNETQNDNGYNNQDEDEAQNESYGQQKSEEYEDQNSNGRAEDPQIFNNQVIKQEQDVVEIESSQNEDQEESEDEVLELQDQNNFRNNQFQQQNFQKNQFAGNQQNQNQRQLLQTPPQQNKMNAYGNQHQSSSKNMNVPQKIESERQNQNNQYFPKTKPQLLAQSPNRGQYIQQDDQEQLQESGDLLEKYQIDLKKVKNQLNQIQTEFKMNKQQQNLPVLKNQQQKLYQTVHFLQEQIQSLNQIPKISDPKVFKGRQNFNGDFKNQQREQNDFQMNRNFSPSKNTPNFPAGSQRSNIQMRPEHFQQQMNYDQRKQNFIEQKHQGNMQKNQFYQKQNNNMRKMNQNYKNDNGYPEQEDDCNQYSDENGPQEQADINDDNQQEIQEIDQQPILIEKDEEDYHVPSFGSQVKQNRDEMGSTQQRNFRNNQSSGNKRIQRSKSPENNPTGYRVQPFSVNCEDDEDQDQQQMQMPILDPRQKLAMQSIKPEQYFNQNVGQKRNFQQYNHPQSNQMLRNRARSVSQSRSDMSSRQSHQFMNQNGFYHGYDRNQMDMQRQNEVNYKNLSEYADHYIKDVHKDNVYSSAKQKDIKYLEQKVSQKQQYLQQLQNSQQQKQIQLDQDEDEEQDNRMYEKNNRNDKIVKQFPKNPLLTNQFNPNQRMQQPNMQNRNFNDHQFNDAKGYKNVNQGEKMQQRPAQANGLTLQKIQAIQQQYSQKQQNNPRPNQQNKPPQNNFMQPRLDQVPHKNLQPLIPPQKRIPIVPQDQLNEPIRSVSPNNQSSSKAINSLSSKKNYVEQTVEDQDENENISIIYPQKKIMQDDPRKLQLQQPQKFQIIEKYQQSNGNMIGFGNKRQYGGNVQMQNQNDFGVNQKKQKLISDNMVNQKQNQHQYQYNQFEGNQGQRMRQVQKGMHDQVDVNLEDEQVHQQFPIKRRRLE